ncbi:MAG: peptide chain release factor N(5)-glutamine methyltransferase [Firmicutes bacterium]|nr:peptide chain release factor N(5)-glutamine methyltransferase [Bacillota bacterium]
MNPVPPGSIVSALWAGAAFLEARGVPSPRLDAEVLLSWALGETRLELYLAPERSIGPRELARFRSALEERATHRPLAYITGFREFLSRRFRVGPSVLIPRPETEFLVETASRLLKQEAAGAAAMAAPVVVEAGTGSGAVAVCIALACPIAVIWATELSRDALAIAMENALLHDVLERIRFLEGDLFEPLSGLGLTGTVDLVVSNPPYVPSWQVEKLPGSIRDHEPWIALDGGPDGLCFHRRILAEALPLLKPGGWMVLEVGEGQAGAVCDTARRLGCYKEPGIVKDYAGIDRVVFLQKTIIGKLGYDAQEH